MIEETDDDATLSATNLPVDTPAAVPAPCGGFLPGRPIEVASTGTGTTNDSSATDTRPPGNPPPPGA